MSIDRRPGALDVLETYQSLLKLSRDISGHRTLDGLITSLWTHFGRFAWLDRVGLILHDPEKDTMRVVALTPVPDQPLPCSEAPVAGGISGDVWTTQSTRVFRLPGREDPAHSDLGHWRAEGMRVCCYLPVSTARTHLGVLAVASRQVDDYAPDTVALLEHIAGQVAIAVEQAQQIEQLAALRDAVSAERDRVALLLRVTNEIATKLSLSDLLTAMSHLLREVIPHHFASLTLWDAEAKQLRRHALVFKGGTGLLRDGAFVRPGAPPYIAFARDTTTVFSEADLDAIGGEPARIMQIEGLRSGCSVPLVTARGKLGTLNVMSADPAGYQAAEVRLVEQIAAQLAIAIENALHVDQVEEYRRDAAMKRDRVALLLRVANEVATRLSLPDLLTAVSRLLRDTISHRLASLTLWDAETGKLRRHAIDYMGSTGVPPALVDFPNSPQLRAYDQGVTVVLRQPDLDALDEHLRRILKSAGVEAGCCVPLVTARGKLGTLNVGCSSPEGFSPGEILLIEQIAGQLAIAIENTLAFQEISALRDQLAEEKLYLEGEITERHDFTEIIGESAALVGVLQEIRTVASTDATVLLLGETGTGKELLARAVHHLSPRRDRTFVRVNGAAMPAGLVESELFGYEKGAFTGAAGSKVGRLELAHRGTLFLDEVGDLPLDVQPKLLRALQEHEFERLGSTRTQSVDVRLIAATNRNLDAMMAAGEFRSDLYYRLNVFPVRVPPLRERPEDIQPLVRHFVRRFSREMGRQVESVPTATMAALEAWQWPGNIRELENVIERAVILSPGKTLQVPGGALGRAGAQPPRPSPLRKSATFNDHEREVILRALRDAKGVIAGPGGAAATLGLKRTTLQSKMRKLGISRPSF